MNEPMNSRILVWDLPTRLFHWLLLCLVMGLVVTGKVGGLWMDWHGRLGIGVLVLLVFRILWGVFGSENARFRTFFPTPNRVLAYLRGRWRGHGHNPVGAMSVLLLLVILLFQSIGGLFSNDDIAFVAPMAGLIDKDFSDQISGIHHRVGNLLLIVVGLHIAAIVFYRLVKKKDLLTPMITGMAQDDTDVGRSGKGGGEWRPALALTSLFVAVVLVSSLLYWAQTASAERAVPQTPAAPTPSF